MNNKKVKRSIIIAVIVFITLLIGVFIYIYLKPIKLEDKVYNNKKINLTLERRINNCFVTKEINSKKINNIIKENLIKEGFKKEENKLVLEKTYHKTCDKLYNEYKNEKLIFSLKGKDNIIIKSDIEYNDEGYNYTKSSKVKKLVILM